MTDYSNLSQVVEYNPETGILSWKERVNPAVFKGKEAGTSHSKGYKFFRYKKKFYFAHRVCWLLALKEWPEGEIDHINGDKKDNRISNLRVVTRAENMRNTPSMRDTTSKYKGVFWHKVNKKWRSVITIDKVKTHLGMFDTEEEAAMVYNQRAQKEWGKYARLNQVF